MLRGPRFVVFYRIVIDTDQSDITSGLIVKNMGQ